MNSGTGGEKKGKGKGNGLLIMAVMVG